VLRGVQKTELLVPGNVDEDFEMVSLREIKEPPGGDMINANEVGVEFADLVKVAGRLFGRGKGLAGGVGRKVRKQRLDVKFFSPSRKNFPSTLTRGREEAATGMGG